MGHSRGEDKLERKDYLVKISLWRFFQIICCQTKFTFSILAPYSRHALAIAIDSIFLKITIFVDHVFFETFVVHAIDHLVIGLFFDADVLVFVQRATVAAALRAPQSAVGDEEEREAEKPEGWF